MSSPIQCDGLSKKFRRTLAIDNLHLQVPEGSIYGLIGPNGAGKSTLIKLLANILRPTSGRATVLGSESRLLSPYDFTRIGYVSENQELPEWMTVGYFLAYLKPFYPAWDDALAREMLREYDLPRDRKIGQLSRGMTMKVALASSLAYRPQLILLDEPFSGLDPLVRDELIKGLLAGAERTTILVSSHDLADIETFASHIGFLDKGSMQFSEAITTLADRFRGIEIKSEAVSELPTSWPADWLNLEVSSTIVRFVDSHFDEVNTPQRITQAFPNATGASVRAMSLREIFVAVAKSPSKSEGHVL